MNIKTAITFLTTVAMMMAGLTSCLGGKMMNSTATGGEVTGISNGRGFTEPTPYGMVKINRGSLRLFRNESERYAYERYVHVGHHQVGRAEYGFSGRLGNHLGH